VIKTLRLHCLNRSLEPKNVLLPAFPTIFLVSLLIDTCAGLVSLAAPVQLKSHYGLSDAAIGLVMGTGGLVYVAFTAYAGRLADRLGASRAMRIGIALIGLDSLLFCVVSSSFLFIALTIASTLGHAFFWPSLQAWFARDVDRRETARRIGIFSVGWSLGLNFVGPKLAGELMESSVIWPFAVSALLSLGVFLFFQWVSPELKRHDIHPTDEADELHPLDARLRFLALARIANLAAVYAMVTNRTFVPLVCIDWGLSPSAIGTLMMVLGAAHSGSFLLLTLTHRWHFRMRYLIAGQVMGTIGLLFFGIGGVLFLGEGQAERASLGVALAAPALILSGAMAGISFMSCAFYGLFGHEEKGRNSGVNESVIGAANVLASYFGSASAHWFGVMGPYWTSGLVVGGCLLLECQQVFKQRDRRLPTAKAG
jgi:MFS family permease